MLNIFSIHLSRVKPPKTFWNKHLFPTLLETIPLTLFGQFLAVAAPKGICLIWWTCILVILTALAIQFHASSTTPKILKLLINHFNWSSIFTIPFFKLPYNHSKRFARHQVMHCTQNYFSYLLKITRLAPCNRSIWLKIGTATSKRWFPFEWSMT